MRYFIEGKEIVANTKAEILAEVLRAYIKKNGKAQLKEGVAYTLDANAAKDSQYREATDGVWVCLRDTDSTYEYDINNLSLGLSIMKDTDEENKEKVLEWLHSQLDVCGNVLMHNSSIDGLDDMQTDFIEFIKEKIFAPWVEDDEIKWAENALYHIAGCGIKSGSDIEVLRTWEVYMSLAAYAITYLIKEGIAYDKKSMLDEDLRMALLKCAITTGLGDTNTVAEVNAWYLRIRFVYETLRRAVDEQIDWCDIVMNYLKELQEGIKDNE